MMEIQDQYTSPFDELSYFKLISYVLSLPIYAIIIIDVINDLTQLLGCQKTDAMWASHL